MTIDLAILSAPTGGTRFALAANDATDVSFSDGVHGDEQLTATLPRTLVEGLAIYEAPVPQVVPSEHGTAIASYRLEQPAISDAQMQLTALGASRAFSDSDLTALWSSTDLTTWRPVTRDEIGTCDPAKFEFDAQDRLFIGLQKNTSYGNAPWTIATLAFIPPDDGSRSLNGVSWDYEIFLPVGWTFRWGSWAAGFGAFSPLGTINSTGVVQRGSIVWGFAANDIVTFDLFRNAANAANATETGDAYVKLTNVRVVSSLANVVSTTLTVARTNGASVTVTVASTARMYVGQRVTISGGGNSESVEVLSVPTSTTFTATVANAPGGGYPIGATVQAFVVYPDEAVRALLSAVVALNPTQLSASTAQIQTCQQDQTDLVYEDAAGDAVLDDLEQRTGWRWAVRNRLLSFAPVGTNAQTWYVDASSLEVQRALDDLANQVYATYQDESGATQRTAAANNTVSQQRFGLIRSRAITADTTNPTLAAGQRDTALASSATPVPQARITFDAIYTAQGARVPPWMVRADDTLIIRNLPPQAAQSRDKIRALLLTRREVRLDDDSITVEAQPLETIERLIGRTTV